MTTPSLSHTALRVKADDLRAALDQAVESHVRTYPGATASSIAAHVVEPMTELTTFLKMNRVSGYPRDIAFDRVLDRSLQRLRRKGRLVYRVGAGWNIPR